MNFCCNQNSPNIVNMYCFNYMKEHYRDHSHLLTGKGTAYCVAPGLCKCFRSMPGYSRSAWCCKALPCPATELPRPLKWPVGGPGGDRRAGEGRSQGISLPAVLPWQPLIGTMLSLQLHPHGPCEPHLLLLCCPHSGEVAVCCSALWVSVPFLLASQHFGYLCS